MNILIKKLLTFHLTQVIIENKDKKLNKYFSI